MEKIVEELSKLHEVDKDLKLDFDELGTKVEEIKQEHLVASTKATKAKVCFLTNILIAYCNLSEICIFEIIFVSHNYHHQGL